MATDKDKDNKRSFPGQHDDETVELVFHQHPIVMRRALIYGMLAILISVLPLLKWPLASWATRLPLIALVIVLAYWFYHWISWYYTVYILTDERLIEIKQKGFFNRKVTEYGLDKIQNINYHIKGFQAALFKFGDIIAQTYVGDLEMKTIYRPVQVHSQLIEVWRRVNASTPRDN